MSTREIVRDIVNAIESVRRRAKEALSKDDKVAYASLMWDALYLEVALVGEAKKLVEELDKAA